MEDEDLSNEVRAKIEFVDASVRMLETLICGYRLEHGEKLTQKAIDMAIGELIIKFDINSREHWYKLAKTIDKDLEITQQHISPGGQQVGSPPLRLTVLHVPSGIGVTMNENMSMRSQHKKLTIAKQMLEWGILGL